MKRTKFHDKKSKVKPTRHTDKTTGAISKYDPKFDAIAEEACKRWGFSNEELAHLFRVSTPTIDNWFSDQPSFFYAIRRGRDENDCRRVESALLKRAMGFEFTEVSETTTILKLKDGKQVDKNGKPVTVEVPAIQRSVYNRVLPPDPNAAIFWLCNRNRDRWKGKERLALTEGGEGPVKIPTILDMDSLNHEELKTLRDLLGKATATPIPGAGRKSNPAQITAGLPDGALAKC